MNINKPLKVHGTYSLPYTIKAEWTAYVVFSVIFGLLILLAAYADFVKPQSGVFVIEIIVLVIFTVFLFWIASFRIIIDKNGIIYKTLFSQKNIVFSEIERVEIHAGRSTSNSEKSAGMPYRPAAFIRMDLFTNSNLLMINMKPFSKKNMAIVVDAINTANPNTELLGAAATLKDGEFGPIIHGVIKKFWQVAIWLFFLSLLIGFVNHLMR
jgi:hypothetical protein